MRKVGETANCPKCKNKFDWNTYFLSKGEAVILNFDNANRNVKRKYLINDYRYTVSLECPICGNIITIERDF